MKLDKSWNFGAHIISLLIQKFLKMEYIVKLEKNNTFTGKKWKQYGALLVKIGAFVVLPSAIETKEW